MLWNMQLKFLCDIHVINNYSFILSMQLYYTTMATTISKVLTELPQHKNVGELTCLGSWSCHHLGIPEFFHSPEAAHYGPLLPHSYIMWYHVQFINS